MRLGKVRPDVRPGGRDVHRQPPRKRVSASGTASRHGPIFVVGMPRSGTTFFQRVVAGHPDLCTTTRATREFPASAP